MVMNNEIVINNVEPQEIIINGGGAQVYGVVDVLVNGISVVTNNIANVEVPTKTSELTNDSGFITNETDPTIPAYIKNITQADINSWNNKQNLLVSGTNIKTINNTSLPFLSCTISVNSCAYHPRTVSYSIPLFSGFVTAMPKTEFNSCFIFI